MSLEILLSKCFTLIKPEILFGEFDDDAYLASQTCRNMVKNIVQRQTAELMVKK